MEGGGGKGGGGEGRGWEGVGRVGGVGGRIGGGYHAMKTIQADCVPT